MHQLMRTPPLSTKRELKKTPSFLWKDNRRTGDVSLQNSPKELYVAQTFAEEGEDPGLVLSSTLLDGYLLPLP